MKLFCIVFVLWEERGGDDEVSLLSSFVYVGGCMRVPWSGEMVWTSNERRGVFPSE
jgi:hypothetical protein